MKKILALLCGLVFASGAWAGSTTYQFSLDLTCPTAFKNISDQGGYYLVNKETHEILMYYMGSEWGGATSGETQIHGGQDVTHEWGAQPIEGYTQLYTTTFDAGAQTVQNTVIDAATKKVTFTHNFIASDKFNYGDLKVELHGEGRLVAENLALIIDDPVLGVHVELGEIGYLGGSNEGDTTHFNVSGMMVVPEPTSGVLLLLGVAGLALRRRKVA